MRSLTSRLPAALAFVALILAAAATSAAAEPQWHKAREGAAIVAAVGFLYVCVLPLTLLTVFLAPEVTRRAAAATGAEPVRSFCVGLGADVVLLILGKGAEKIPLLHAVSVPLLVLLVVGGTGTIAEDLGRRVWALGGREASRLARLLCGWALLAAAGAVPFVGWLLIGPLLVTLGVGGFVRALVTRAPGDAPAGEPAASRTARAATAPSNGDPPPAPAVPPV